MSSPGTSPRAAATSIPRGEVIGRYQDYLDAQKVVDYLADNDFPVSTVSIIGNDLKMVERVRGKLTYPRVAAQGAAQGAMLGLFFGLLLLLFSPNSQFGLMPLFAGVLLGAVIFMLMNVIGYAAQRGKRDFSSTRATLPSTWDVVVEPGKAAEARALASKLPMTPDQAGSRPGWGAPAQQPPATPSAPEQQEQEPRVSAGYEDLEDGRPRFGVRVEESQKDQQASGEQDASGRHGAPTVPDAAGYSNARPQVSGERLGQHRAAPAEGENAGADQAPDEQEQRPSAGEDGLQR